MHHEYNHVVGKPLEQAVAPLEKKTCRFFSMWESFCLLMGGFFTLWGLCFLIMGHFFGMPGHPLAKLLWAVV